MNILVTGANGFIGKNLITHLEKNNGYTVLRYNRNALAREQSEIVANSDIVFHLAGVNRPLDNEEFKTGNSEFTARICQQLARTGREIPLIFTSSIQAASETPYGLSKLKAEKIVQDYAAKTQSPVAIYRLSNIFGKWCQPNYNSVVATFCHNIARDIPITISDPLRMLSLVYIEDVINEFLGNISDIESNNQIFREVLPIYQITLEKLAEMIQSFRQMRSSLHLPELESPLVRKLYATYLSYLEANDLAYSLNQRIDPRGTLAEFIKAPAFGQVFVSRTKPGIIRGNHFHNTKTEKFLVLEGDAIIRFQHIITGELIEYPVRGTEFRVVDIPPGYIHSIENVGSGELVTLFWASEIFEPKRPDTYFQPISEFQP